jgi:hypothetical protein
MKTFKSKFAFIDESKKIISLCDTLEGAYRNTCMPVLSEVSVNINDSGVLDVYSDKVIFSDYFYYDCYKTIDEPIALKGPFGLGYKKFSYDELISKSTHEEKVGFWFWLLYHKKISFEKKVITWYINYQIAIADHPIELHYHGWELRIVGDRYDQY